MENWHAWLLSKTHGYRCARSKPVLINPSRPKISFDQSDLSRALELLLLTLFTVQGAVTIDIKYFFQENRRHVICIVFRFFGKKFLFQTMKNFQLDSKYQNLVFSLVWEVKPGSAPQKTVNLEVNYLFLFRLNLLVLSTSSRLWRGFWSDPTDSVNSSVQSIRTTI